MFICETTAADCFIASRLVVQQLFQRAHEYANLANRAGAIPSDVLLACEEFDIPPKELYQVTKTKLRKRKRGQFISANRQERSTVWLIVDQSL